MKNKKESNISITSKEMRALEVNSEYFGVSLLQLMENAGRNIAQEIALRFHNDKKITIYCGLGGNGGDGFVAARHLLTLGFQVSVILAGKSKWINHESALKNWIALRNLDNFINIQEISDSSVSPKFDSKIVVDALLGTGCKKKLRQPIRKIVDHINALDATKVAIDVPTGIDSDTGDVLGVAVKADITVTFHKIKPGLFYAKQYCGEVVVRDIGLPIQMENMVGPGNVALVNSFRASNSHKGDFGRLLVIGGSKLFSGAPVLVSLAALRTGVDLVYTACPEKTAYAISSFSPNLITIKLKGKHVNLNNIDPLISYIKKVDVVVIGPGLGVHSETFDFIESIINEIEKIGKPLLLDADGITAFSKFKRMIKSPAILTPHVGEFIKLSEREISKKIDERIHEVQKVAADVKSIIVLKGENDIISDSKRTKINFTGNPGMTVGGTGDVLSGIIGGLLAQNNDPFEAAVAGTFVNGAAGDFAAEKFGYHMVATDLLNWIPTVLDNPMSHIKVRRKIGR
jgi:NAD(P)H-hydrate epimerase